MENKNKSGFISIFMTYLYVTFLYPIVKEIKGRKRRGYIISKKERLNVRLISEYLFLLAAIGLLLLISYKCMT